MKKLIIFFILVSTNLAHAESFYLGDWIQSCTTIGEDDVVKNKLLIDSKIMDQVVIAYEEENCKTPYLIFKRQYQIGSEKFSENERSVDVEMSVVKVTYLSLSDEVTASLNLIAYCGSTDWQTYKEKIVTGKSCQNYQAPDFGVKISHKFSANMKSEIFHDDNPIPYFKVMP